MATRCEDFPCCGHEPGCCPDFDESGNQLNMVCTCGAKLPVNSRFSICRSCLNRGSEDEPFDDDRDCDFPDDMDDPDCWEDMADDELPDEYWEENN